MKTKLIYSGDLKSEQSGFQIAKKKGGVSFIQIGGVMRPLCLVQSSSQDVAANAGINKAFVSSLRLGYVLTHRTPPYITGLEAQHLYQKGDKIIQTRSEQGYMTELALMTQITLHRVTTLTLCTKK